MLSHLPAQARLTDPRSLWAPRCLSIITSLAVEEEELPAHAFPFQQVLLFLSLFIAGKPVLSIF